MVQLFNEPKSPPQGDQSLNIQVHCGGDLQITYMCNEHELLLVLAIVMIVGSHDSSAAAL